MLSQHVVPQAAVVARLVVTGGAGERHVLVLSAEVIGAALP